MKCILLLFLTFFCICCRSQTATMMTEVSDSFLEKLILIAEDNDPQLRSLGYQVNITELNVKRTKISWFDVANISYNRNKNLGYNPGSVVLNGNGYQYGIGFSIGTLLQKPTQVKIAKEQVNIAIADRETYFINLERNVRERYYTYVQQTALLKVQLRIVQDIENIFNLNTAKFGKGEISYEAYNANLTLYNSSIQQKINAEAALLIAKADLESVIGTKMENVEYWRPR